MNGHSTHAGNPRAGPSEETGKRLATLPRNDGAEEVRISLDEFNGHKYISLRLWFTDDRGNWWPTKKGVTIRPRELAEVLKALKGAAAQLGPAAGGSQSEARRRRAAEIQGASACAGASFDEFADQESY